MRRWLISKQIQDLVGSIRLILYECVSNAPRAPPCSP